MSLRDGHEPVYPAFWGSYRSDDLYAALACEPRPYRAIGRVAGKSELSAAGAPEPPSAADAMSAARATLAFASAASRR